MKLSAFRLLTAVGLIAFLQVHTFAADLRPALEAMARQDYDTLSRLIREQGLTQLLVAAAQGHKEASKLKSALVITIVLLTDAEKQRVDQLTRQYWNEYVLPFQPTD